LNPVGILAIAFNSRNFGCWIIRAPRAMQIEGLYGGAQVERKE